MDSSFPPCPWTNGQLKKLGKCIRDGTSIPAGLPPYKEVMEFYNEVSVVAQTKIDALDWKSLLGDQPYDVTSRPKTIDTLKQKLQREHSIQLPNIQDVAGVRFEAQMSLDEQDAVAQAIAGLFNHGADSIRDMRSAHHSGYRAVHVWLRLPFRVEVQVRTHLQGEWANMYEVAADLFGRDIRYGQMPSGEEALSTVQTLHRLSLETIVQLEDVRNTVVRSKAAQSDALIRIKSLRKAKRASALRSFRKMQVQLDGIETTVRELEHDLLQKLADVTEVFERARSGERF